MALSYKTATLMTREEKAFVRASESKSITKLGEAVLRAQIEHARHLRKKYDDLLKRQRAEAQSQRLPRGSRAAKGNAKTLLKVGAFQEASRAARAGERATRGADHPGRTHREAQAGQEEDDEEGCGRGRAEGLGSTRSARIGGERPDRSQEVRPEDGRDLVAARQGPERQTCAPCRTR
jgi:hypothetical protein